MESSDADRHGLAARVSGLSARLSRWAALLGAVVLTVMMLHVVLDVGLRAVLNSPLPATLEIVSNWWMVAIAFLGLGYAKSKNEHIAVTLLSESMSPRLRAIGLAFVEVVTVGVLVALMYFSLQAALEATASGQRSAGLVPIPIWPARFLVPLGAFLFALAAVASLMSTFDARGARSGVARERS